MKMMAVESSFLMGPTYLTLQTCFVGSYHLPLTRQEAGDSGGTQLIHYKDCEPLAWAGSGRPRSLAFLWLPTEVSKSFFQDNAKKLQGPCQRLWRTQKRLFHSYAPGGASGQLYESHHWSMSGQMEQSPAEQVVHRGHSHPDFFQVMTNLPGDVLAKILDTVMLFFLWIKDWWKSGKWCHPRGTQEAQ